MHPSSFPLLFATLVLSAVYLLFLDSSSQKCAQLTVVSSFPFCGLPLSYFHWINHILNPSFLILYLPRTCSHQIFAIWRTSPWRFSFLGRKVPPTIQFPQLLPQELPSQKAQSSLTPLVLTQGGRIQNLPPKSPWGTHVVGI